MPAFFQKYLAAFSPERFVSNPGFHEKIDLLFRNIPSMSAVIFAVVVLWLLPPKSLKKRLFGAALLVSLAATPAVIRLIKGYAYDSSFGFVGWIGDLVSFGVIAHFLGNMFLRRESHFLRIVSGVVILLFTGFVLTLFGVQRWLGPPQAWVGMVTVVLISIYIVWILFFTGTTGQKPDDLIWSNWEVGLLATLIVLPIVPYLFAPAPPDSDVTVMSELTGLFLQGQTLQGAMTGMPGEVLSIRYPSGTPGLAWLIALLLGIFASEALLLLWLASWILLALLIAVLAKEIGARLWVVLLFTLNLTFTGAFGLGGGQIPEMFAYALGIGMVALLIQKKAVFASTLLAGAMILHPVVAIPFGIGWGIWVSSGFFSSLAAKERTESLARAFLAFLNKNIFPLMALVYLAELSSGKSNTPSHPALMISQLSISDFFRNAAWWLDNDTFHLWIFIAALGIPLLPSRFHPFGPKRRAFLLVALWFLGACLINALFGSTAKHNYSATFQAGFSVAGIWVLCAGLFYSWVAFFPFKFFKWVVAGGILALWYGLVSPGFGLTPVSVFATHSDIRMGRYLHKNLPPSALIANVCPYSKSWGQKRMFYSLVRGDSLRNTIFNLFGGHQIKSGKQTDRTPFISLTDKDIGLDQMARGFKKMGASHLFILSRPESDGFVAAGKLQPVKKIGSSYVFDLNSL